MKITAIEAYGMRYIEPNDYNSTRHTLLVKVSTDAGISGWGEGMAMWPEAVAACVAIINHGLDQVAIGRDPLEIEAIWQAMKDHVWWYGLEGGIASFAISAIDMALWDVKGKALELPLYKLLGGKVVDRLPANASIHVKHATHEENAEEIYGYFAEGYQSCKVGFGKRGLAKLGQTAEYDLAFIQEVRHRIGPDAGFMVDIGNNVRWTLPHAIQMTKQFMAHGVNWMEDPFPPNQLDAIRRLREATGAWIATGERLTTIDAYSQLIDAGVADIIAIDPARSDGITGFVKVLHLVESRKLQYNTHAWSSALTTAASIHLSVISNRSILMELKPLANPMQHELVTTPIVQQGGWVHPPEEPGLGVEIVEETVRKYRFI